ncbi:hypothetical protein ACIO14_27900 [Nocardia fluminea]|uniref:hypothetical protein n=1 Tax=Nocardia fluminea TaxID=134984 RepID=UPI00380417B2
MILYLTYWYLAYWFARAQRARITTRFILAIPLSSAFGAPVSTLLLSTAKAGSDSPRAGG